MLNAKNFSNFKETVAVKLNENMAGIIQSIFGVRSTLACLGFSFISTISATIGGLLTCSTIETILSSLIDRSKVLAWFPKLTETIIKFLSHTNFYPSMFVLLKKKAVEGNSKQLELCCLSIKTILSTHGSKEYLQITIEGNPTVSSALEYVLEKGLEKGNSKTKAVSKEIYSIYNRNWPDKAELFRRRLNPKTLKWIPNTTTTEQSTTKQSAFRFISKKTASSPKQRVSLQKSKTTPWKQTIPKSRQVATALKPAKSLLKQVITTSKSAITGSSSKAASLKKPTSFSLSAPATTRSHELKKRSLFSSASIRQTNLQVSLAANNLLKKLKSTDTNTKCLGIQALVERLKDTPYSATRKSPLPKNVPKKVDLSLALMNILSLKTLNSKVAEKLMSWDSIAGLIVRAFPIRYYGPTLIIADEQRRCQDLNDKQMKVFTTYSQGLKRVKMFLKRNDSLLAYHLLSMLKSVMSSEQKALDASLKHDLKLNASYQESLEVGLLKWMNELVENYVGVPQDEDEEMSKEGAEWLTGSDVTSAEQWFQLPTNVQAYMDFVTKKLLVIREEDARFGVLCDLLRNLKIGNDEVFVARMKTLNNAQIEQIQNAISSNRSYVAINDDECTPKKLSTLKRKRDSISSEADDDNKKQKCKVIKIESAVPSNPLASFVYSPYNVECFIGTPPGLRAKWQAEWDRRYYYNVADPPIYPDKVVDPPIYPDKVVDPPIYPDKVVDPPIYPDKVVDPPIYPDKVVDPPIHPDKVDPPVINNKLLWDSDTPPHRTDSVKSSPAEAVNPPVVANGFVEWGSPWDPMLFSPFDFSSAPPVTCLQKTRLISTHLSRTRLCGSVQPILSG
ncbi:hypothetical protein BD770DRAFT_123134 [Pilaira anomala]|nr:hypothetical protein BD770DRAFT_123134 [Pilaira anomala]